MTIHPVELVYKSLTGIVELYIDPPENVEEKCSCCERPAGEFGYNGYRFKNSYRQMVMHCQHCQSYFVSAPDILGVETPLKPTTSQKFVMWNSVGALINLQENRATLLAPKKVFDKLPSIFFEKVDVINLSPGQHIEYLFSTNIRYPLIYIQNFGRRTYDLIRSFRVSHSGNALYACSDVLMNRTNEASHIINLNKAKALYEEIKTYSRNEKNVFIRTVQLLAYGMISPAKASEIFRNNNMVNLVRLLPPDPHQRLVLLNIIKKVCQV